VTGISGVFLQAVMIDTVHMVLEHSITEHIVKLELTIHRKSIWHNKKRKPMLYVQLKKAVYGTIQVSLLFWKLLSGTQGIQNQTLQPMHGQ
jgi:hypothetical protein